MARPVKPRIVCSSPKFNVFGNNNNIDVVIMTYEEYEVIRLIDYNNLSQEEASTFMDVARTTVQGIYESARKKISDSIVNGKTLKIEGGNYNLCTSMEMGRNCNRRICRRFND